MQILEAVSSADLVKFWSMREPVSNERSEASREMSSGIVTSTYVYMYTRTKC